MNTYLMPDGNYTENIAEQAQAWDKIATKLSEALGVRVIGFVPNYVFAGGSTISRQAGLHLYQILEGKE